MKSIISTTLGILGLLFSLSAQNSSDALRYSFLEVGGTARTASLGGALGALGADFTVLSTNPAGLAAYRSSDFTFTPTVSSNSVSSRLVNSDGEVVKENNTRFNFNNIGLVIAKQRSGKMKTVNFGIGFNRLANFNGLFSYSGKSVGSYVDRFVELATDENRNPIFPENLDAFEAGLAYLTGAIYDPNDQDGIPEWGSDFGGDPEVFKEQLVRTKGSLNEIVFSLAGNYEERLMFGGTIGINILNFSERKTYQETDTGGGKDGDVPFFNELSFIEDLTTSGLGINAKVGVIYRFSQAFRLGFAVHTPTFFSMDDTFYTEMVYNFSGNDGLPIRTEEVSPDGSFDYGLRTPMRVQTSAGFIIKKKGFLTAEVEWVDYSSAQFNLVRSSSSSNADALYQRELNQQIEEEFKSAINVRLGGEYALNAYRFRLGAGFQGTPFVDGSIQSNYFTGGLGYRAESFYLDLAYRLAFLEEGYVPYLMESVEDQQLVNQEAVRSRIMLTLGFRF